MTVPSTRVNFQCPFSITNFCNQHPDRKLICNVHITPIPLIIGFGATRMLGETLQMAPKQGELLVHVSVWGFIYG